ncbi:PIN domain-containing protein [bacterium CPR1]|nr:PIN domain-containing protein [bacterium CPR1]
MGSAADPTDAWSTESRAFLGDIAGRRIDVILPAFAPLEIACALARRLRDASRGRSLAEGLLRAPHVRHRSVDALLARATHEGPTQFLRGADALYAALAQQEGGDLLSWDTEQIERAGARTPRAWQAENR